jgi:hypothetical protein
MSTFLRSTIVALAILSSASATMARPVHETRGTNYSSYEVNSPDSVRAFWDDMQRWGN